MATTSTQETGLLDIGKTCSHPNCNLVDFLPFKCQHCSQPFCSDHYKPGDHSCAKFDAAKHDRVAPQCPFCATPVAFPPGSDPNIAMERHFEEKCEVVRKGGLIGVSASKPSSSSSGQPRCQRGKCNKVLVVPIKCPSCPQIFCAEHRFPEQHNCRSLGTASKPAAKPAPTSSTSTSRPDPVAALAPKAKAGLAAINRAAAQTKEKVATSVKQATPSSSTSAGESSSSSSKTPRPFSKTDRWEPVSQSVGKTNQTNSPSTNVPSSSSQPESKPAPVIPQSFIPRSIFATA